jgi:hypothetical protein
VTLCGDRPLEKVHVGAQKGVGSEGEFVVEAKTPKFISRAPLRQHMSSQGKRRCASAVKQLIVCSLDFTPTPSTGAARTGTCTAHRPEHQWRGTAAPAAAAPAAAAAAAARAAPWGEVRRPGCAPAAADGTPCWPLLQGPGWVQDTHGGRCAR